MALRGLLLCVLLLVQSLAHAEEANQDLQTHELIVDATLTVSTSGCGLCQTTGLCSHAFRGSPGQFCQTLVTGAPCCCPIGAQCVSNAYACRCRTTAARAQHQSQPQVVVVNSGHNNSSASSGSSASTVIILMILGCCVCCCCMSARKQQRDSRQDSFYDGSSQYTYGAVGGAHSPPAAYAVPQPGFGNIYPTAPPAYQDDYHQDHHNGNGKTYAAAAVGALGGLGVGALLGSTFGGGGQQQQESSYFAGDTGGDYGNQTTSYEFSGDTGGDYGGDSGGDFAGDS